MKCSNGRPIRRCTVCGQTDHVEKECTAPGGRLNPNATPHASPRRAVSRRSPRGSSSSPNRPLSRYKQCPAAPPPLSPAQNNIAALALRQRFEPEVPYAPAQNNVLPPPPSPSPRAEQSPGARPAAALRALTPHSPAHNHILPPPPPLLPHTEQFPGARPTAGLRARINPSPAQTNLLPPPHPPSLRRTVSRHSPCGKSSSPNSPFQKKVFNM